MTHKYYSLLLVWAIWFPLSAQAPVYTCASDTFNHKSLHNEALAAAHTAFESAVYQHMLQRKLQPLAESGSAVRTIPVVVHIIHDFGAENLPDAQIIQAIDWLNDALANSGSFSQGSGADTEIRLCLAQRTPDNQPTTGITRTVSPLTNLQYNLQDAALKNLVRWDPHDYLNIWVVREICHSNGDCGVGGYTAQWAAHGSAEDGIVMEARTWGLDNGFTPIAAHEIGHYFGLYHTFYQTCSNNNCFLDGDRICDTPPDQSTAGTPCNIPVNSCSNDTDSGPFTSDQPDMTWNFMDYGQFACMHDFTADQAARMNFTLSEKRKRLLTSNGCRPPCQSPVEADIEASRYTAIPGQLVLFGHMGMAGAAYEWWVDGQLIGDTTIISYSFSDYGSYLVQFIIYPDDPVNCSPDTASFVIEVSCPLQPMFSISDQEVQLGETVYFQNQSQGFTTQNWYVNGVLVGPTLNSLTLNEAGVYEIRLEIGNAACSESLVKQIVVRDGCDIETWQTKYSYATGPLTDGNVTSCVAADSSLLVFGPTETRIYVTKINAAGTVVWAKYLDGFGLPTDARNKLDVCGLPDNGFAMILSLDGSTFTRALLLCYDAQGQYRWSREFREPQSDLFVLRQVSVSRDGNLLVCGSDEPNGLFGAKLDLNGNILWSRHWNSNSVGIGMDAFAELPSGNIVFAGFSNLNTLLLKTDPQGDIIWQKTYSHGWNGLQLNLSEPKIHFSPADQTLVYYQTSGNNSISKVDTNGVIIWTKTIILSLTIPLNQVVHTLRPLQNGEILFTGKTTQFSNAMYVAKADADLNPIWTRYYKSAVNNISSIVENPAGGYYIAGMWGANGDIWVQKTDKKGFAGECEPNIVSIKTINRSPSLFPLSVEITAPIESVFSGANLFELQPAAPTTTRNCAETCDRVLEICNNGNDDDLDGLHDCQDPDCDCTNQCRTKRNNHWLFGYNFMNFNTFPPTVAVAASQLLNLPSAISDENGNLLYYSNGSSTLFNREFSTMLSPFNQNGGQLSHHPGNPSTYFCFSHTGNQLKAFVIDGSKDFTLGGVKQETINLEQNWAMASRRLSMVNSCQSGYWVAVHEQNSNRFKIWHVGTNGINTTPVLNDIGPFAVSTEVVHKFSPDGRHLAMFVPNNGVYLFDFDSETGLLSTPRNLDIPPASSLTNWSLEFSPNGRFLYVWIGTSFSNGVQAKLVQYDLESPGAPWVLISEQPFNYTDMQLGPDGVIYLLLANNASMGWIRTPDLSGVACTFVTSAIYINSSSVMYLPSLNSSDVYSPHIAFEQGAQDTICDYEAIDYLYRLIQPKCYFDSTTWRLEGISGTINVQPDAASIRFLAAGSGRLIVDAYSGCGVTSDTLSIYIPGPESQTLNLGPDLNICQNGVAILDAGAGFFRYRWSTGSTANAIETIGPGKYWVDVWDECGNLQSDTIGIWVNPAEALDLGPAVQYHCPDYAATYELPDFFKSWQWLPDEHLSCTDCPSVSVEPGVNFSWIVTAQNEQGCIGVDTLTIQIIDTLYNTLEAVVCTGETLVVHGVTLPADTTAVLFLPASGGGCDTLLTVQVMGADLNSTNISVPVCSNDFLNYNGTLLPPDTTAVFHFLNQFGCDSAVTVQTTMLPPISAVLPEDTTLKIGALLTLMPVVTGTAPFVYAWTPDFGLSCNNCPDPQVSISNSQTYFLSVFDANGCMAGDTISISIDTTCSIVVPNAFTPNSDQANDFLRPITDPCVLEILSFKVINRWGRVVFEERNITPNSNTSGWDGEVAGNPHPSDVLIWIAEYRLFDGTTCTKSGESNLIR